LHFTITIKKNGTITIPVLNRNYYVHNLYSIRNVKSPGKGRKTKV